MTAHWKGCKGQVVKTDDRGSFCALCGTAISTVPKADRPPQTVAPKRFPSFQCSNPLHNGIEWDIGTDVVRCMDCGKP